MIKLLLITIFFSSFPRLHHAQEISTTRITNLTYYPIPQYELPKRYLVDSQTTFYPKENPWRRADIVFFISIPITMFLLQNIINFLNIFNIALNNYNTDISRDNLGFTSSEWNYLLSALFLIPMGITIYDAVYVQQYPVLPTFRQDNFKETRVNFSIYRHQY